MHKTLILKAFEKAKQIRKVKGDNSLSVMNISKEISDYIDKRESFTLSPKRFEQYYTDAKNKADKKEDIIIHKIEIINGLCSLLGYKNYEDFLKNNSTNRINFLELIKKNKRLIFFGIILIIITIAISISANKQRWMEWQEDRYVKVKFDTEKLSNGSLKLYKEERIESFRKIIPDCNTLFFNKDGSENLWYGKNYKKELEYFTDLGLHPETGKTLDPITDYMIKKYICESHK